MFKEYGDRGVFGLLASRGGVLDFSETLGHNLTNHVRHAGSFNNRGFPKIDHSGIDARIVLEQIN